MKLKQAGLIHKPLYVVPNHLLEQFGREFLQLYPNARLLMAGKEDVTRERRKLLTARIASGAWDGIITTHSSFERMGMSHAYQAQFPEQIAAYEQRWRDRCRTTGRSATYQGTRKQKAKREDRLRRCCRGQERLGLVSRAGIDNFFDESRCLKTWTRRPR